MTIADRICIKLVLALCLLGTAVPASGQTLRYVSDEFQVPVREEPREASRIVTLISSGTRVEVLQAGVRGYSLVRAQGSEGWMRTRDLMSIPSGSARLALAEKRFQEHKVALEQYAQQEKALRSRITDIERHNQALQDRGRVLSADLETLRKRTAEPLATEAENRRLGQALRKERWTIRRLMDENDALKMQAIRDWFLIGTAVTLGSLLLGFLIARIPGRKQRIDDDASEISGSIKAPPAQRRKTSTGRRP